MRTRKKNTGLISGAIVTAQAVGAGFMFLYIFDRNAAMGALYIAKAAALGLALLAVIFVGVIALRRLYGITNHDIFPGTSPSASPSSAASAPRWESVSKPAPAPTPSPKPDLAQQIKNLDWFQFEKLAELLFRKQGYSVRRTGGANADHGIDLILQQDSARVGVQCKHWKTYQVGVRQVRELFGALHDQKLNRGILLCSGKFTDDAHHFAIRNNITLYGKGELFAFLKEANAGSDPAFRDVFESKIKICPRCESEMVLRIAQKGTNTGSQFWGCSGYRHCRYTLEE